MWRDAGLPCGAGVSWDQNPMWGGFFGGKRAKSSCTRGAALLRDRFHLARAAGGQSGLLFPTDYCSRKQNHTKRGLFESGALKAAAEAAPLDGLVLLAQQSCPSLRVHFWISNSPSGTGAGGANHCHCSSPFPTCRKGALGQDQGALSTRGCARGGCHVQPVSFSPTIPQLNHPSEGSEAAPAP